MRLKKYSVHLCVPKRAKVGSDTFPGFIYEMRNLKYSPMTFFLNFLNSATHLIDLGHWQEEDTVNNQYQAIEPVVSKRKSIAQSEEIDPELEILVKEFGELSEGKQIVVELRRLLLLLPRKRKKADSYKGLRTKLKKMSVELIITSKTKKK